ncbi:MAG TPA: hypothetical protein VFT78_06730 [Hanamia sp.]|nr:hypothetical protein [Hanamia sp.]
MKILVGFLIAGILFATCQSNESNPIPQKETATVLPIAGTWKLISGTLIEKGDTNVTDYTKDVSFIKIINNDHFAFLTHDTKGASDSAKTFDAGGGSYTLKDSSYTEHLQYCLEREWEGHDFTFTVTIKNDTLTQRGIEKVPNTATERLNIEKYVRMK